MENSKAIEIFYAKLSWSVDPPVYRLIWEQELNSSHMNAWSDNSVSSESNIDRFSSINEQPTITHITVSRKIAFIKGTTVSDHYYPQSCHSRDIWKAMSELSRASMQQGPSVLGMSIVLADNLNCLLRSPPSCVHAPTSITGLKRTINPQQIYEHTWDSRPGKHWLRSHRL